MTPLEKFLTECESRLAAAPDTERRLLEIVKVLIRQRNGYRDNYWAVVRPALIDQKEIIKSDDEMANAIAGAQESK